MLQYAATYKACKKDDVKKHDTVDGLQLGLITKATK